MNRILSKEEFIVAIEDIKSVNDYHSGLNDYFHKNGADGYLFQPDCTATSLLLLHKIFGDSDNDNWIEYFCFDLNFGEKWKPGLLTEKDGTDIRLETADDLYELLCSYVESVEK